MQRQVWSCLGPLLQKSTLQVYTQNILNSTALFGTFFPGLSCYHQTCVLCRDDEYSTVIEVETQYYYHIDLFQPVFLQLVLVDLEYK